jgi:AraC-like DNA-binding protein
MSTVYFRELFHKVYGVSPMNYIQNLRIRRAKEMLRSDYSSITDIAFALGYNNIYEFSKAFKKHTGVPPTKY